MATRELDHDSAIESPSLLSWAKHLFGAVKISPYCEDGTRSLAGWGHESAACIANENGVELL